MKSMMIILLLVLISCAPMISFEHETADLNLEQSKIYREMLALPLSFNIEKDCDVAWQRALVFVSENSIMRIRQADNNVIETYFPRGIGCYYKVTRVPVDGRYFVQVYCTTANWEDTLFSYRNAKILVYYMLNGVIPLPEFKFVSRIG